MVLKGAGSCCRRDVAQDIQKVKVRDIQKVRVHDIQTVRVRDIQKERADASWAAEAAERHFDTKRRTAGECWTAVAEVESLGSSDGNRWQRAKEREKMAELKDIEP